MAPIISSILQFLFSQILGRETSEIKYIKNIKVAQKKWHMIGMFLS